MIQITGIPVGSDLAPFFTNFLLALKEANWVKAQRKLGKINIQKISNSFIFIDDLLSLNDGCSFKKHSKGYFSNRIRT